jgi:hypothetical protein
MYFRLEVLSAWDLPARIKVIFNLMSSAASAGFGQVRCGNGGGLWTVLGAQEKGSRASRGTIQLLMLVPKPLEWKGPCLEGGLVSFQPLFLLDLHLLNLLRRK